MIAELKGILVYKAEDSLVIDVNGVGYEVGVPARLMESLPEIGQNVHLFIYTQVAESVLALYGFGSRREKALFKKLITISGIGPKSAVQILSKLSVEDLIEALVREDLLKLTAINGIGKKTAERMIVELKDKMLEFVGHEAINTPKTIAAPKGVWAEVASALLNLGYPKSLADKVVGDLKFDQAEAFEPALKKALSQLVPN
jgi:Holliday junction DNA helicase RuvA